MVSQVNKLSSFDSKNLTSNIPGLSFKQFKRTYPGNYSINYALSLSGCNDFKTKSHTNFYLTDNYKFSDVFSYDTSRFKTQNIFGSLMYGDEYLKFSDIDSLPYASLDRYVEHNYYGVPVFTDTPDSFTNFTLHIKNDNFCNISYTKDYKKFYLCLDIDNKLSFVKETLLNFSLSTVNPQDFTYLYSEKENFVLFFKETDTFTYFITKEFDSLVAIQVTDNNLTTYLSNPFKISKNIFSYPNISLDMTSITYAGDNTINKDKSQFGLTNNFLIHRKYSGLESDSNIIVLKNQLLQNDVFTSGNNLLSSLTYNSYTNNLREYTSISNNIKEENDDSLILNYVFYNQYYDIKPGSNEFSSPSSMYPFDALNVNDSKFIDCGAFSYLTPEYSDKIYHLANDKVQNDNGQYLLCTWLSGSPFSEDKIWIDRYYYPDLIEKSNALTANQIFNPTYDNYIEKLILQNTNNLQDTIQKQKIFDKVSDLAFVPNQKYRYDRVNLNNIVTTPTLFPATRCDEIASSRPTTNYFKQINESGQLTISFNFIGDSDEWIIKSDRNDIDSGVAIHKTATDITISCDLYDATTLMMDGEWYRQSVTVPFQLLKNNFVCVSIDTKTKDGYFFLNNNIVNSFNIPDYTYLIKKIIYGDFFSYKGNTKTNILYELDYISNINITDAYTDPAMAFTLSLFSNKVAVDDMTITLPCGMRNSSDDIDLLNNVCSSSVFKSNNVNIHIKNLNVSNENILSGLKEHITSTIRGYLPANSTINNVEFTNFK